MKRTVSGLVLVLWCLLPLSASAAEQQRCEGSVYDVAYKVPCSATWLLTAPSCLGIDMWAHWNVSGRTNSPDSFIRPWLDYPIMVIGYELLKIETPRPWLARLLEEYRTDWWFGVGSTIHPDGILSLGPGETHSSRMWPAGMGQPWPSKQNARPVVPAYDVNGKIGSASGDLIDLHGACFGKRRVSILLTVYYVSQRQNTAGP